MCGSAYLRDVAAVDCIFEMILDFNERCFRHRQEAAKITRAEPAKPLSDMADRGCG
jgi:hypothetical protein